MAQTTSLLNADASPIEKLPAELLERILLYTVEDIKAPNWHSKADLSIFPYQYVSQPGRLRALQARLVCRKFRDMAWRTFGEVLRETAFDISSRNSIETLQSIAKQSDLAPWISKCRFTCMVVSDGLLSEYYRRGRRHNDAEVDHQRLQATHQVELDAKSWFREFFVDACSHEYPGLGGRARTLQDSSDNHELLQLLVQVLSQFKSLSEVTYFWDSDFVPGRYNDALRNDQGLFRPLLDGFDSFEVRGAHVGLNLVIQALAGADIEPVMLDLAVELDNPNTFITYVSNEHFLKVCRRVTQLTLRAKYFLVIAGIEPRNRFSFIAVTKSMFPALKELTIDNKYKVLMEKPIALPHKEDIPRLSRITVLSADLACNQFQSFIQHYGQNIRVLALQMDETQNFHSIDRHIRPLELDVLSIQQGRDSNAEWWWNKDALWRGADDGRDVYDMPNVKDLQLSPDSFRGCYYEYWLASDEALDLEETEDYYDGDME